MEEKRMLELADRLVELKESKAATEAQLSAIIGDIEAVQAHMVAIMTEQECSSHRPIPAHAKQDDGGQRRKRPAVLHLPAIKR